MLIIRSEIPNRENYNRLLTESSFLSFYCEAGLQTFRGNPPETAQTLKRRDDKMVVTKAATRALSANRRGRPIPNRDSTFRFTTPLLRSTVAVPAACPP